MADVLQAAAPPASSLLNGQHSPVDVVQASTRRARATTMQDCRRRIIMAAVRVGRGACLGECVARSQAEFTTVNERLSYIGRGNAWNSTATCHRLPSTSRRVSRVYVPTPCSGVAGEHAPWKAARDQGQLSGMFQSCARTLQLQICTCTGAAGQQLLGTHCTYR